ncbi:DnaJ-domain-containing protein [Colletotrichum sublineola]|nr:DnaJ-domain-containing protein [Colletotrichum sublineola]
MSSLPPDPYKILGVSKDAKLSEIRSAHRKLVLKCHPDKVQDPTLKAQKQDEFQKVQQAYELLSNENDRAKYDDNVKLAELRKEMAKSMAANTSAPRAPRTYEVRTAEPRPDTFTKTTSYRPSPNTKLYSQYNSRSYEEDIYNRSNAIFEEPRARRAASYEKPSRQDDDLRERRRREEKEREREELVRAAERRERERLAEKKAAEKAAKRAAEEKEARRQERKRQEKAEKEREKERKREAEEKSRRHKPIYSESYEDDTTYVAKSDKKKSSSSKEKKEDKRSRSTTREVVPPRDEMPPPPVPPMPLAQTDTQSKYDETLMNAAKYMQSRKANSAHPGISRAQTFDVRPPSRRSSETKTREKSSHKKSSPSKEAPLPPSHNIVDASPSSRHVPYFASTTSPASTSPPKYLNRSATLNENAFSRPPPGPVRAQTFSHVSPDADLRGRGRSRMQPQVVSEDSESEDDRRRHRSARHRTHSPEPMPTEYGQRTRYTVSGGRTVAVPPEAYAAMYREESPPPSRKHNKGPYYERPPMPTREASYSSSPYFPKVKTARYEEVQYSNIPHRYREEYSAYA